MHARLLMVILVSTVMAMPVVFVGCEQSHTERTSDNLFGGQTHEETTVTKNPVTGNTSVEHEKQVTH